jgi:hypothetical protein
MELAASSASALIFTAAAIVIALRASPGINVQVAIFR